MELFGSNNTTDSRVGTRAGRAFVQKIYSKWCRHFAAVLKEQFHGCGVYNIAHRIGVQTERSAERFIAEKNPTDLDAVSLVALGLSDRGDLLVNALLEECEHPWADDMRRWISMGRGLEDQIAAEVKAEQDRIEAKQRLLSQALARGSRR